MTHTPGIDRVGRYRGVMRDWTREEQLAERLLIRRHELGLTLMVVAERVGVSFNTLANWEKAENRPASFSVWQRWAEALGMRFECSLTTTDAPK
jgi:transcriptional regulator with XRE-family HTH domain